MVDVVVKIGGALLAHADHLDAVLAAIGSAPRERRLLVVPGGGPFADAVRDIYRRFDVSDEAAHWMAVLAMDQYAHLIAERLQRFSREWRRASAPRIRSPKELRHNRLPKRAVRDAVLVAHRPAIEAALDDGQVPVLAPFQWMREADPLPHSWNVTSDSIAAWIAGQVGARRLVLVKPPGASDDTKESGKLVDSHFSDALPSDVRPIVVAADRSDALRRALRDPPDARRDSTQLFD